jgi:hypothetical protein
MPEAFVSLETIIHVLRANRIEVSQVFKADGSQMTPPQLALAKGDPTTPEYIFEVVVVALPVKKEMLTYLARKFRVPIHQFYNPLMAPALPGESIQ